MLPSHRSGAHEHQTNCRHCPTVLFPGVDQSRESLCGQFKNHLEHELAENFDNEGKQFSK